MDDENFILLVRDIQYDDISKKNYNNFNSLYDVALNNNGHYIRVENNYEILQEPPDPSIVNKYNRM